MKHLIYRKIILWIVANVSLELLVCEYLFAKQISENIIEFCNKFGDICLRIYKNNRLEQNAFKKFLLTEIIPLLEFIKSKERYFKQIKLKRTQYC